MKWLPWMLLIVCLSILAVPAIATYDSENDSNTSMSIETENDVGTVIQHVSVATETHVALQPSADVPQNRFTFDESIWSLKIECMYNERPGINSVGDNVVAYRQWTVIPWTTLSGDCDLFENT